jgi:DNA invertase Pin-like site-specific DNA recombinase
MSTYGKINNLSNSAFRKRFFGDEFVPENNLAIRSIRVSSKKQERGQSLAEQNEITDKYSRDEHLKIEKTWEVAESASKHEVRRHFHEMIAVIKASQQTNRPVKHLIFSHQSRSNRNKKSARELEELVEMGITLHFARDRRKLTCKSDIAELMMWHMENLRNEGAAKEIQQNAMGGIIKCIERGCYPGGKPPYGYKGVGRKDRRQFELDGHRAEYMQAAFNIVASPIFYEEQLSDERLKTKLDSMFPRLERTPNKKQFCELLRNPFYTGEEFLWAGDIYKANSKIQPALISRETWLRVQDVLVGRHKARKLSKAHPYIGMMTCRGRLLDEQGRTTDEICGCAVTAEQSRKVYKNGTTQHFNYYRCSNQTRRCSQRDKSHMGATAGRNVSYTQAEIETVFQDIFKSFSFDEVTCQRMTQYLWQEHFEAKATNSERLNTLQNRQQTLNKFVDQSYEDKLTGAISEELWQEKTRLWESERAQVIGEMTSLGDSKDEYMIRGVALIELMQHSEIIFKNATPEKKRKMVELVSSNLLLANGNLEYH